MRYTLEIDSSDAMVIIDALDIMKKDGEINPEDRIKARRIERLIVNKAFNELKERIEDGCEDILGEGWQD